MEMNPQKKHTILVCDDEPDILTLTKRFLEMGGYNTLTCNNGKEAMKIVEEKYQDISLILLDIMMPGKSGYNVLEEIKTNESYKHINVVLFTVRSFNEDVQKGKRLGADYYITKPFSGNDLLRRVDEIIKKLESNP